MRRSTHEDVREFEIAVEDALRMERLERSGHLCDEAGHSAWCKG
jgi:hypothetical protein